MQEELTVQTNPLGFEKVEKLIFRYALPSIVSFLVSAAYNIVDQLFIGNGVGLLGNAATNVAFPIVTFCAAVSLLFGVGGASGFNLEQGRGNKEKAAQIAGSAVGMLAIGGIVICGAVLVFLKPLLHAFGTTAQVFPYAYDYTGITAIGIPFLVFSSGFSSLIRADGSPKYSMISVLTGAVLNTILDPIFIFVCGWGIQGAAAATVIGQAVSGCMSIAYIFRFKNVKFTWKLILPRLRVVGLIASLGLAACVNQLAIAAVQITLNNTLSRYGADSVYGSDIPLACVGVISKVGTVFFAFVLGIGQGCQPLFGFNYGAKNYARVRKTYMKALFAILAISVAAFACFQLFPRQITKLFGHGNELYYQFAEKYFRIYMFMTFLNGIQPLSSHFFTSIGKAPKGVVLSLTRQTVFLLPLILLLAAARGIDGVMYAGPVADFAAALTAGIMVFFEMRKMKKAETIEWAVPVPKAV